MDLGTPNTNNAYDFEARSALEATVPTVYTVSCEMQKGDSIVGSQTFVCPAASPDEAVEIVRTHTDLGEFKGVRFKVVEGTAAVEANIEAVLRRVTPPPAPKR
jgi:hypothetical protein